VNIYMYFSFCYRMTDKIIRNLLILAIAAAAAAIFAPFYARTPLQVPERSDYNRQMEVQTRRYGRMWLSDQDNDGNVEITTQHKKSFGREGDVYNVPMTPGLQKAANEALPVLQDLEFRLESEAIKAENAHQSGQ